MKYEKTLASRLGFFNANEISAFILAGGQSKRFGYDKLLAQIGDTSLLDNTITVFSKLFKNVIIVAKDITKFSDYHIPILLDDPVAKGPMSGIIAALKHCPTDYCFLSASDFWGIKPDIIYHLYNTYNNEDFLGYSINGRIQPLFGIYKKSSLKSIQRAAEKGKYSLVDVLESFNSRYVQIRLENWRNVNYPSDLKNLRSIYAQD